MIQFNMQGHIINALFEQTNDAGKKGESGPKTKNKSIFHKVARLQLLIELFNSAVSDKKYDISYELIRRFVGDFIRAQSLPIFSTLLSHFMDDTSRYEAKIALLLNLLPVMNRKVGG